MKILYDGSVSGDTIETMKSKHGIEFVNAEEHKRQKTTISKSKITKPQDQIVLGNTGEIAGSRKDLMDQARNEGIKNFRILNKAELTEILNSAHQERIDQIIKIAKKRWMSGWGTKATAAMILMACNLAFADLPTQGEASFYTVKSCHSEGTSGITASTEPLNDSALTCALPSHYYIGKRIRVTNISTGKSVTVTCNDYGPNARLVYEHNRIIDLSQAAFMKIANLEDGIAQVEIEVLQ